MSNCSGSATANADKKALPDETKYVNLAKTTRALLIVVPRRNEAAATYKNCREEPHGGCGERSRLWSRFRDSQRGLDSDLSSFLRRPLERVTYRLGRTSADSTHHLFTRKCVINRATMTSHRCHLCVPEAPSLCLTPCTCSLLLASMLVSMLI